MARDDPTIYIRIPAELKAQIDAAAKENRRSFVAEVASRLSASFDGTLSDAGIRLALQQLAESIRELGDESEGLRRSVEAMADIAGRAARDAAAAGVGGPSIEALATCARLARVIVTTDSQRSFAEVQSELLKLARAGDGDEVVASLPVLADEDADSALKFSPVPPAGAADLVSRRAQSEAAFKSLSRKRKGT